MEALKRLFGFAVEEDPLKREIEEIRRLAREAVKSVEKAEKQARKAGKSGRSGGGRGFLSGFTRGSRAEESGGLSRAVEEMETIFTEIVEQR